MAWTIKLGMQQKTDSFADEMAQDIEQKTLPLRRAVFWLFIGLITLTISSRILVWGAVAIAHGFGVSDLIIGLTIVGSAPRYRSLLHQ